MAGYWDFGRVGADGAPGADGAAGAPGADGPAGPSSGRDWTWGAPALAAADWTDPFGGALDPGGRATPVMLGPTALDTAHSIMCQHIVNIAAVSGVLRTVPAGNFRRMFRLALKLDDSLGLGATDSGLELVAMHVDGLTLEAACNGIAVGPMFASALLGAVYDEVGLRWDLLAPGVLVDGPPSSLCVDVMLERVGVALNLWYKLPGSHWHFGWTAVVSALAGLIGWAVVADGTSVSATVRSYLLAYRNADGVVVV